MTDATANNGRVLLPQDLIPVHYNLEIVPDFDQLVFLGNEEVSQNIIVYNLLIFLYNLLYISSRISICLIKIFFIYYILSD